MAEDDSVVTLPKLELVNVPIEIMAPEKFVNQNLMRIIESVPQDKVPFIEIFDTIEGEGLHIGTPRVLARISGCAVGCQWCDTRYSWGLKNAQMLSIEETINRILEKATDQNGNRRVREISITGGEPMHYPAQIMTIARRLRAEGFLVSIETSGMILSPEVFGCFDMVSMDVKGPSSGVPISEQHVQHILKLARRHRGFQLKAVVSNRDDLEWIEAHLDELLYAHSTMDGVRPLVLTPCAEHYRDPSMIKEIHQVTNMILEWNRGYNIRIITQQHKLITYDPEPPVPHPENLGLRPLRKLHEKPDAE